MSKVLNLSAHTSDEELQHITNLLLFHLVEQCGGQNVNKVSSAIHLQFDSAASSLPPYYKHELLKLKHHRISQ